MVGGLLFYWRYERKNSETPELTHYPFFSILVPCHNEQDQIEETVRQLTLLDYPDYEIIVVDDGSTDDSVAVIQKCCQEMPRLRAVYLQENQGKAAALNIASLAARGDLFLTLDADALLSPGALRWMAWHFVQFPRVGAVTGNPRIINRTSLLAKIQTGEFATIIGLIKRTASASWARCSPYPG